MSRARLYFKGMEEYPFSKDFDDYELGELFPAGGGVGVVVALDLNRSA